MSGLHIAKSFLMALLLGGLVFSGLALAQDDEGEGGESDEAEPEVVDSDRPYQAFDENQKFKPDDSTNPWDERDNQDAPAAPEGDSYWWKALLGLMLIFGLMFVIVLFLRKFVPGAQNLSASPSIKLLGRTFLTPKQMIYLVRVGGKVLVVGVTSESMNTLSEISDPDEVTLLTMDKAEQPKGLSGFRDILFGRMNSNQEVLDSEKPDEERNQDDPPEIQALRKKIEAWENKGETP